MDSNRIFTVFQKLPVEMRLKIWAMASYQEPRILDIWTDFHRCEQDDITFFAQSYGSLLTDKSPPPILHTSREAREEGLKHYTLEFKTVFPVSTGINQTFEAKFYINYATYTLVPRGYWNAIAFWDLIRRGWGKLAHLAIDVTGSFWKDNMLDVIASNEWVFEGMQEIILYSTKGMPLFERADSLSSFKRAHNDGPRDLSFVRIETTGKQLDDAEALLAVYFDKIDREVADVDVVKEEEGVKDETSEVIEKELEKSDEETVQQADSGHNAEKNVQRTRIRIMELVASVSTGR